MQMRGTICSFFLFNIIDLCNSRLVSTTYFSISKKKKEEVAEFKKKKKKENWTTGFNK